MRREKIRRTLIAVVVPGLIGLGVYWQRSGAPPAAPMGDGAPAIETRAVTPGTEQAPPPTTGTGEPALHPAQEPAVDLQHIRWTLPEAMTLEAVAARLFRDGRDLDLVTQALLAANPGDDTRAVGTVIWIPKQVIHEVREGETLGSIAASRLGNVRRYTEIFEANRGALKSPEAVEVGMKLTIEFGTEAMLRP